MALKKRHPAKRKAGAGNHSRQDAAINLLGYKSGALKRVGLAQFAGLVPAQRFEAQQ